MYKIALKKPFDPNSIFGEYIQHQDGPHRRQHVLPPIAEDQCQRCGALMWKSESAPDYNGNGGRHFSICCDNGSINLPLPREPPEPFISLIRDHSQTNQAHELHSNIRWYNHAFAMASMVVRKVRHDSEGHCHITTPIPSARPFSSTGPIQGPVRISGTIYHLIAKSLTPPGTVRKIRSFVRIHGREHQDIPSIVLPCC